MWRVPATVLLLVLGAGCGGGSSGGSVDAGPGCTTRKDCGGDRYCDVTSHVCVPFGVGAGTTFDDMCTRDVVPGVFFPEAQCEWLGPPVGDPFPMHKNILGTPMVATFGGGGLEFTRPSIVFISYNCDDGGNQSCIGVTAGCTGVIRVIDGRTCTQEASITTPAPIPATALALGDLDGDGSPEIVAAKVGGGVAAWKFVSAGNFQQVVSSAATFGAGTCNWTGPSIHDLDDDGQAEILLYGGVFDSAGTFLSSVPVDGLLGKGYIPVVADVDADGLPELVTGAGTFAWDRVGKRWTPETSFAAGAGNVAVADLGTFGASAAMDDRATLDGLAETVVVLDGHVRAYSTGGRLLMDVELPPGAAVASNIGGPPTIADLDGDRRAEIAVAGGHAYTAFDLDCVGTTPDPQFCPSMRGDRILWTQPSQDLSSNVTGSSVFDFEGDGVSEVVYGDECFTRVYDGRKGDVMYSRYRTSCTWFENPVIADVDGDFNAEILITSNSNCDVVCPAMDPIFDGVRCLDDSDCPRATRCAREAPADRLGRCRCQQAADCGGDGFTCADPIAGASAAGKVCRAAHPGGSTAFGLRVVSDQIDRWVNTRRIWNQHAYAVTNVEDSGRIPRTSAWMRNWQVAGLNNFRQNAPGNGAGAGVGLTPDLTVRSASARCVAGTAGTAEVTAEVCNRGTEPVGDGLAVAFYRGKSQVLACTALTQAVLRPGACETVHCVATAPMDGYTVVADDAGMTLGQNSECREDNNTLDVPGRSCP